MIVEIGINLQEETEGSHTSDINHSFRYETIIFEKSSKTVQNQKVPGDIKAKLLDERSDYGTYCQ